MSATESNCGKCDYSGCNLVVAVQPAEMKMRAPNHLDQIYERMMLRYKSVGFCPVWRAKNVCGIFEKKRVSVMHTTFFGPRHWVSAYEKDGVPGVLFFACSITGRFTDPTSVTNGAWS